MTVSQCLRQSFDRRFSMSLVTRCKVVVDEMTISKSWDGSGYSARPTRLVLSAVMPKEGDGFAHSEDHAFFNATPSARFEIQIQNARAAEMFQAGDEFYVDFTKVERVSAEA